MENHQQILTFLGLAFRAGKIVYGAKLFDFVKKKKINLAIVANDMGETQKQTLINKLNFYQIKYFILFDSNAISHAIGKENIKALGIIDLNFAKKICKIINDNSDS